MRFIESFRPRTIDDNRAGPAALVKPIAIFVMLALAGIAMGWGINNGFLSLILLMILGIGIAYASLYYPIYGLFSLLLVTPVMGFVMRLGIIPNVGAVTDIIVLSCLAGFLAKVNLLTGLGERRQTLVVLTAAYLVWGLVEVFNAQNPSIGIALFGFRGDVFPAVTFFLALFLVEDRHLPTLNVLFLLLIWVLGLYMIKQMVFGLTDAEAWWIRETPRSPTGGIRYFSTMISAGVFGTFMLFLFLISLSWYQRGNGVLTTILYLASSALCVFCIFACQVRGIWIGLSFGLMSFLLFKQGGRVYRILFLIVVVVSLFVLFDLAANDRTDDPFLTLVATMRNPRETETVRGRLGSLAATWVPTVLGHPLGMGSGAVGGSREQGQSALKQTDTRSVYITDNYYATIATNYGWPGVSLLLLVFGISAVTAYRLSRREGFPHRPLAFALLTILVAVMALTFSGGIETIPVSIYFWFFIGLLAQWNGRPATAEG